VTEVGGRAGKWNAAKVAFEALFEDKFVVVAGAHNPLTRKREVALAELVNEPWVMPPARNIISSVAMECFRTRGLDYPRAVVVTESPQVRLALPATGPFLTMFASSALRLPIPRSEIKAVPVPIVAAAVPNGIITLKNRTLNSVARLFIKQAREVAKLLGKSD
jgi:DNA-binding transcriptional LysR family regulator